MGIFEAASLGRVKVVDDTGPAQMLQVDQGPMSATGARRLLEKLPFLHHFGFTSSPPIDSDVLIVRLPGNRAVAVAIAGNDQQSRLKNLQPGDTAIYDVRGAHLKLTAAGMEIDAAGLQVTIKNFSQLRVEGDLHVTGDVVSRADGTPVSLNGVRDAYHVHKHTLVKAGTDSSGPTDHDA